METLVTILDAATGGSFRMDAMRGPAKARARQEAMELMAGCRVPLAKCGVNALRDSLVNELCIDTHGMCLASVDDAVAEELKKAKKIGDVDLEEVDEMAHPYFL